MVVPAAVWLSRNSMTIPGHFKSVTATGFATAEERSDV
jgi:hypothetical protein